MNDLLLLIKKVLFVPIHPAGYPFIGIFAVVTLILAMLWAPLGFVGLVLTLWCVYFFRNPVRYTPVREGLVVSPADGIVSLIQDVPLPPELADMRAQPGQTTGDALCDVETTTRVSVFLNVFDVHVNRIPADGEIRKVVYHPGKFLSANLDKASLENERSTVLLKMNNYPSSIAFVQIAGLVARRIICKSVAGQQVRAGELYGLIRFGSRVDIYLPPGVKPLVSLGQRMVGGESVIADVHSQEAQRLADAR
ncbi:MAG TPA: phosphatidylserine decarboxylase [Patescibacteria group bacterium]|nr:phosphatidylserine decarboxylase [Patescibacteria group bacterium]